MGPHRGLKIKRRVPQIVKGHKTDSCGDLILYENLRGRVLPLRSLFENKLGENKISGEESAGERQLIITPRFSLNKIKDGDIVCIPWGIRPNTYTPPSVPNGYSPAIILDTPSGRQSLFWNGSAYSNNTITITYLGNSWQISGEVDFTFQTDNFRAEEFPTGYSFEKLTGYLAEFKIIQIDEEVDHLGRLAFYILKLESEEIKGIQLQE